MSDAAAPPTVVAIPRSGGAGAWMTLKEASGLLGVAPSTVRRWGDAGRLPSQRTPGGHRRFDAAAVRALAGPRGGVNLAALPAPAWGADPAALGQHAWHTRFAGSAVAGQMRGLGQRLLGLLIQYLVWQGDEERFLADGRAVGSTYGTAARGAGVGVRDTVQAFLYFRSMFWRTALKMPAVTQSGDAGEIIRISERIDHFTNEVLLSALAAYD